ncbi:NUDIX domain-containing protein [Bacillus sp. 31A1R]|uniref:NUDIX domain-containing protein n=1 Tax=Robertmurraya mangrovi TaxID=3098077 RepID=A0ABU5IWP5_9BACI|nr:NUDIX domain-containing protein [Bacillus sp. 31A1R]MDZ5471555.1 NUDIX domain-containing protein [Bacillus sp. 31A1R]
MEIEMLKIFDDKRNEIGTATREEVHRLGYWHETFHCWLIKEENNTTYIYFQLRSKLKKDYPNLLDITAAGHLLSHESVEDGIREMKEEIGIDVSIKELQFLDSIDYCVTKENFIDKEIAHVFLYDSKDKPLDFILQVEEVSGMARADFYHFARLWSGEVKEIKIEGFEISSIGERESIDKTVGKEAFVSHEDSYYASIIDCIQNYIENHKD